MAQADAVETETRASEDDMRRVAALCAADEEAFVSLIEQYHTTMIRLAMLYLPDRNLAEEVVQETWLAVLQGVGRFEGRCALKTWIYRILANKARTRWKKEGHNIPFSALSDLDLQTTEPSVEPERFLPLSHPRWAGHWVSFPGSWSDIPEDRLLSQETLDYVRRAIDKLPAIQREVITLRDMEGWPPDEVSSVLGITEPHQRVLLHRARSKVRGELEQYLAGDGR